MATNGQITGMRGVYLVAAHLSKLGFIVSPTSRSAAGADLLITTHDCSVAYSVQVKTNAKTFGFWLVGQKGQVVCSKSHIYVFLNIKQTKDGEVFEFFVVPSKVVCECTQELKRKNSTFYSVAREDILKYQDRWKVLGTAI